MSRRRAPSLFEVPEVNEGVRLAVEEVSQFFVDLRGVGHFPSPSDSQYVVTWCAQGAPVDVILRAIHAAAAAEIASGRPLRNLAQLKVRVDRDLRTFAARSFGRSGASVGAVEPASPALVHYIEAQTALLEEIEADARIDADLAWQQLAARCRLDVSAAAFAAGGGEPSHTGSVVQGLVAIGRRFYDGVQEMLDDGARRSLRDEAEASLEGWIRPMSPEMREQTVRELMVNALRQRLGVLRPEDLFQLWGET